MKKERNEKILITVSLIAAIITLTIGFAAFSNTLTISSGAKVTPDASDFKLLLYGLPQSYDVSTINVNDPRSLTANLFTSKTLAGPIVTLNSTHTGEMATIENDTLTIKNIKAKFTKPSYPTVQYVFLLKNEGHYDAYGEAKNFSLPNHTCTPEEGTSKSLVDAACKDINFQMYLGYIDDATNTIEWDASKIIDSNGYVKLEKGKYWYLRIVLTYESYAARADGPFYVNWDDINIELSTAAK